MNLFVGKGGGSDKRPDFLKRPPGKTGLFRQFSFRTLPGRFPRINFSRRYLQSFTVYRIPELAYQYHPVVWKQRDDSGGAGVINPLPDTFFASREDHFITMQFQ